MKRKGIRLAFWFCAGFSASVFAAILLLPASVLPYLAIVALGISVFCFWGKPRALRILTLALLGAAFGLGLSYEQLLQTLIPSEGLAGQERQVECRVVEQPRLYESSQSIVVRLSGTGIPSVRCRITSYESLALEPGDELRCTLRFSSARILYGEESDSLTAKGIFLRGSVRDTIEVTGRWRYAYLYAPLCWKEIIIRLSAALFPSDIAAFQTALLTGEKDALYRDPELETVLTRAGLMHVAAVSGMHVSFLMGVLSLLLPNKRLLALAASPLLLIFAALTGFTPSICRAVFMQLVLLLAPPVKREADSLTSLALALTLLLCLNPCSAGSVSLQLSFASVSGILLFGEKLNERMTASLPKTGALWRILRLLLSSAATSLAASVFTMPLMAIHFGSLPVIAPISNALCLWLISFLFVGGFAVLALGSFLPSAGAAAGRLLARGDRFVLFLAKKLSALPFAAVYTVNRLYLWWLLSCYGFFAFFLLRERRAKKTVSLLRPLTLSLLCLCAVLGFVRQEQNREVLTVTALKVGQGACTLLEQGNTAVMVDCGGTNPGDDVGSFAGAYLFSRGRTELSALIMTHLHEDHANGVEKLMGMARVQRLYLPRYQDPEAEAKLLALAKRHHTEVVYVDRELLLAADDLVLRLSPPPDYEKNEPSMFVRSSYGEFDVLITGDADASLERRYVEMTGSRDIELLLVGHHGSKSAGCGLLLDSIQPKAAIISVGSNSYGHPAEETLNRLKERNIAAYRTDLDGSIRFAGEKDGSFKQESPRQRRS